MNPGRSWRVVASLLSGALAATTLAGPAAAQGPANAQVVIDAVGPRGIDGLALLGPAQDGGTNVQVLVSGAAADTFAVIHAGSCEAIDPAPVALLGDVSTVSQVTVPNPFATIADGGHVLALHQGLDLTAAVGCGAIPAMATAPPLASQPPATGGSFTSVDGAFDITWPSGWERYEVVAVEGEERIGLRKGSTSVLLAARREPSADAQGCVRDARQDLFDRLDSGSLRDLAPLTDAQGSAISGVEGGRAWIAYAYVSVEEAGAFDVADYLECRAAGDVLVFILHRSAPPTYARDAAEREALLAGLTLAGGVPAPPTVPGPTPTPNAGCDGYGVWHPTTLARVDALTALKAEADDAAIAYDEPRYVAALVRAARDLQRMRGEQEADPVPPAAREANGLAVTTFETYASAARLLAEYYQSSTTTATLQRAARAQRAAEQVEAQFNVALSDVEAACG